MTVKSLVKKIFNILDKYYLRKYRFMNNLYFVGKLEEITNRTKILLYFPYYEFMHFGDHLFFEPLLKRLLEVGFDVYVMPIKQMEFYFLGLDYKIGNYDEFNKYDLIISKTEFIRKVKKYNKNSIYIDTAYKKIEETLCNDIVNKIFKLLSIDKLEHDNKPTMYIPKYSIYSKFNLNFEDKYIVYNNYVDSGSFRIKNKMLNKLEDFVKKNQKKRYKIIHLGTNNDKKNDLKKYDFIDLDLRGKTTPEDLFGIVSLHNVYFYVGFDNFLMHLFFLVRKKNYVMFRGRYLKSSELFIKEYVNPPFVHDGNRHELIEYI